MEPEKKDNEFVSFIKSFLTSSRREVKFRIPFISPIAQINLSTNKILSLYNNV